MKSTSYRAMIPLLKRLGFIDQSNIPNAHYRNYREKSRSKIIMAERIRTAYKDLFAANEYANTLTKKEIISKLNTLLGTPMNDIYTPIVAGTFLALNKLADFEGKDIFKEENEVEKGKGDDSGKPVPKLGITYTINLNLPATTDVEVFNAIFKALKENLLR